MGFPGGSDGKGCKVLASNLVAEHNLEAIYKMESPLIQVKMSGCGLTDLL